MEFLKNNAVKIAALILLLFFGLNIVVSMQESTTMDEKAHIPSAYSYVRYGDMRLNPEHPPLLKDLAGLALLPLQPEFPLESKEWQTGINEQWVLGDKFINCLDPSQACNDPNQITFWSRVPIILVAILLGVFIFMWTRELAGSIAALFAVLLYAFDPNVIAHSHYVTTDIGIAAFLFFSFYYFVHFLKNPTAKNVLLCGIWLALAQLAKFSAVLLFPIFGMFVVLYALSLAKPAGYDGAWLVWKIKQLWSYGIKFTLAVLLCFIIIWIYYYPHTMNMPGEKLVEVAQVMFPDKGLGPVAKQFVGATHGHALLKPYSEYFLGVFMVFARVAGGNTYYFLGGVSNHASPWYFPVVFLLKETLPFLFLLVVTVIYSLYRIGRSFVTEKVTGVKSLARFLGNSLQQKTAQYVGVFFVLFYSFISITGNLNIGIRHLFPIMPFLYMFIAKTLFDMWKRQKDAFTQKLFSILLLIIALSVMAVGILAYPNYLSYFNSAFGGHTNGYQYVTDSNYDWGQDVKRLKTFVDSHNRCAAGMPAPYDDCTQAAGLPEIKKIRVDYFGGSSPAYYLGDKYESGYAQRGIAPGWYAISAGFLQESLHKTPAPGEITYADWLIPYHPVARAGDSIFIFYIPEESIGQE